MSEDQLERDVLGRASFDRRSFIKKMVAGAAFAVPVVVSFDMLTNSAADGVTCAGANGTAGESGSGTTGGNGGTRNKNPQGPSGGACGGTPQGGTGGAAPVGFSDRAIKTDVVPVFWE